MKETQKHIEISEPILRYLRKEASKEERKIVEEWLKDDDNQAYLNKLKQSEVISKKVFKIKDFNDDKYLLSFKSELKKKKNHYYPTKLKIGHKFILNCPCNGQFTFNIKNRPLVILPQG